MPLYEYRCRSCEHTFEILQKMDDRPLRTCERCAGRLEKLVSRTSFQLRGGGWYSDGYGRSSTAAGGSSRSSTSSRSDAKGGSGTSSQGKSD